MVALQCAVPATASPIDDAADPVRRLFDAFNAHDPEKIAELVADEFEWLSVTDDGVSVETAGRTELRHAMVAYFESVPTARSQIEKLEVFDPYVVIRERASWEVDGAVRSQTSLSVWLVRDDAIARVWYFPPD